MKASELMIGDWVLTLESTHKEKIYAQIWAIEEGQTSILVKKDICNWFVDIEWIEPIPLTPEILEKNTFESNKNLFGLCNYELSESYILENQGDRFCLSRIMAGHKYSTFWICDIHYVHELQHCLKLVGIEKEITL